MPIIILIRMKNLILFFILFISSCVYCQDKYGYQWQFTNHNIIDFRTTPAKIDIISPLPFYDTGDFSSNICDKNTGDLLFISGGCYVQNKQFRIMKNGDSINSKVAYWSWCRVMSGDGTFPMYQNNTIIPMPNSSNKYFLFNLNFDTLTVGYYKTFVPFMDSMWSPIVIIFPRNLYQNIIDMNGDNGLGEVIEKKKIVLTDTLCNGGYLTVTRHKNGKDWWLVVPEWKTNCYYVVPVTANGAGIPQKQCLGLNWRDEDRGGQVDISPDGTKYARVNKRDTIVVFNFNNETGQFSNPIALYQPNKTDFLQGVCFSQNSRFLYVMHLQTVYQFDLQATDVQKSMKIIADIKPLNQDGIKGQFQFSKLAPDGKIYISSPFNHRYLSVINRPNCPGTLCDFKPYAIELKFFNWGAIPNNPHFNIPPANYTCDSLPSPTQETPESITLSPNPTQGTIQVSTTTAFDNYIVVNAMGQAVQVGKWNATQSEIDVAALPEGIYFVQLLNNQTHTRAIGRFVLKK